MGSLTGGVSFHTYNEIMSGGSRANSTASITCKYTNSITANGAMGGGSALYGKNYNITISSAGVNGAGTSINLKTITHTPTGGAYAAGYHTNTAKFNSTILSVAGVLAAGSVTNNQTFRITPTAAGVIAKGAYGERTTTPTLVRTAPRPTILFEVTLYDYANIVAYPQPDNISNIVRLKGETKLNIPGVIEGLVHGEQFTLYGEEAVQVRNSYSDFLTVISSD